MDFELSADQTALQEGIRNLCEGRFDMATVRELAAVGGVDRGRWGELADMGLFALRIPEQDGGVGLGWADTVLAFEELGRALVPGPVIWTQLVAGVVPGAATGEVIVGGIERADESRLVEHLDSLDRLLVLDGEGAWLVDPAELQATALETPLDPLTPVSRYEGELPQGERVLDADGVAALRLGGAALTAAMLLGVSEAIGEASVAFASERVQFDRPIGAFQAVKHILADMFTRTEVARAAVYAAGVTLDDPAVGSVARAVGAAKVTANEAGVGNGKAGIQVHGGMGYTWEVDAHLYFKRAYVLEPLFGSTDDWSEVVAQELAG